MSEDKILKRREFTKYQKVLLDLQTLTGWTWSRLKDEVSRRSNLENFSFPHIVAQEWLEELKADNG